MTGAVWLLDVDGVLNATRPGWGAAPHRGRAWGGDREYVLRWAPALLDRIRTLRETRQVEIRWCTTWCAYVDQLERLWSLPPLGRAFTEPVNGVAASIAKLAAARAVLDAGHRLIWTDDVEVPEPGDPLHDELGAGGRSLLIRPQERRGLQPEHLDAITAFVAAAPVP